MKRGWMFALVSVALVGVGAAVLMRVWIAPAEQDGIVAAAVTALVTQGVSFLIIRLMGPKQVIAAWGLGAILRVVILVVFALVVAGRFGLPLAPAAISLAVFLFVTTVVEPFFLTS
jgi:hypothetical protein